MTPQSDNSVRAASQRVQRPTVLTQAPRWTHEQIRAARIAPLAPLLKKRGIQMRELPAQNIELPAFKGLVVKDSYWRWPEQNKAGNAIDFFVQVLGLSFHDAMRQIIES